jgi:hypothetical protein
MVRQAPLEFLFYAESHICAGALADALESLGYDVAPVQPSLYGERLCVTGLTLPLADSKAAYEAWVEQMGALAREHGCEFDGLGEPYPDEQTLERLAIEASERDYAKWLARHGKLP